ncbi:MAG: YafY family protein [Chloroflexota bacterium]
MRADRLLSILFLLQMHQRMTTRELATRLEVSSRTIHRDMEALCAAGIPLVADRGAKGGWFLAESFETSLTGLNRAEIQALFFPGPSQLLHDLGLQRASEAGFIKLLATLPAFAQRDAEYARQRIYIDSSGWQASPEQLASLGTVQNAIWQERQVQLVYQRGDASVVERVIDPLGLVAKGQVWYLVAAVDGNVRSYRVSRIHTATMLDTPCVRPSQFDLAQYWEQSSTAFRASLPQYRAAVRIEQTVLPRIRWWRYASIDHADEPDSTGWIRATLCFEIEEEAIAFVLSCNNAIEVLEPAQLHRNVKEQIIRLSEHYSVS